MQPISPTQQIIDAIEKIEYNYDIIFHQNCEADYIAGKFPMEYGEEPISFWVEICSEEEMEDCVTISSSTTIGFCYFENNVDLWLVPFELIEEEFHSLLIESKNNHLLRNWKLKKLISD
jgi:hypothetical protein